MFFFYYSQESALFCWIAYSRDFIRFYSATRRIIETKYKRRDFLTDRNTTQNATLFYHI